MQAVGVTQDGGFQEYCTLPAKTALKISDDISLSAAAFAEPIACCLHGIDLTNIQTGDHVLVIGAGTIGQIMIQLAKNAGASRIFVIEPNEEKRDSALTLGANEAYENAEDYIAQNIRTDRVIECAGKIETVATAINAASKGATVMIFGLTPPKAAVNILPFEIFKKELTITSSFVNPFTQSRAIGLLAANRINTDALIGEFIPLEALANNLRYPSNKTKVMVKF
jgi:threonine dehydrogenase-like Zn-dependent dehydrogenase